MKKVLITIICAFILTGCGLLPVYEFSVDEPKAEVEVMGYGFLKFCVNGKYYQPVRKTGERNTFFVPAGNRITVEKFIQFSGYNVNYSCRPNMSFIPDSAKKYIINDDIVPGACVIETVQKDDSSEVGVRFERTIGRANCNL